MSPTYLSHGQWEVGRDEIIEYARRLAAPGVPTELHPYPGAFHVFEVKAPAAQVGQASPEAQVPALRRALTSRVRPGHAVHGAPPAGRPPKPLTTRGSLRLTDRQLT
ncbi:alpha/beta hydrolase fold domain-containing protein [Frankia alni]|uniref:alpha/beta hydrolase n=1 Tax=Frankia sp. AvcI1 TaxID=573496 RepID=UPI00156343D3